MGQHAKLWLQAQVCWLWFEWHVLLGRFAGLDLLLILVDFDMLLFSGLAFFDSHDLEFMFSKHFFIVL